MHRREGKLGTLDFFFNKLLPKKFIVIMAVIVLIALSVKIPDLFFGVVIAYITHSAVVSSIKKKGGGDE